MRYWMEIAITAGWTLLQLSRLSAAEHGEVTIKGKPHPAAHFPLIGFFALHSGLFILAHLNFPVDVLLIRMAQEGAWRRQLLL